MDTHKEMRHPPSPTRTVMEYLHHYHGYHGPGAVCHVAVYEEAGRVPVFLVSEVPENQNTSITNLAEYLAAEVALAYNAQLFENRAEEPFIWVEHYPTDFSTRGHYDRVRFGHYRPLLVQTHAELGQRRVRLGEPEWRRLTYDEVAALIGEHVPEARGRCRKRVR